MMARDLLPFLIGSDRQTLPTRTLSPQENALVAAHACNNCKYRTDDRPDGCTGLGRGKNDTHSIAGASDLRGD
jgi:hypothetical protein